jgi:hypothetical protein
MDDFVISNLHESRNEWCSRLVSIFTPLVAEGVRSLFNEAWKLCLDNDEANKYLMTFQNLLSRVPKWNNTIIEEERKRIIERSGCNYLEDLITCVHIIQLKVLTCVRVGNKQKKIDISIPKLDSFIHKIYINVARKVYSNVYLFEKPVMPLQQQKNNRELELIIQECIMLAIRESVPTESIIRAYLDESVEQEEEVIIDLPVPEPNITDDQLRSFIVAVPMNNPDPEDALINPKTYTVEFNQAGKDALNPLNVKQRNQIKQRINNNLFTGHNLPHEGLPYNGGDEALLKLRQKMPGRIRALGTTLKDLVPAPKAPTRIEQKYKEVKNNIYEIDRIKKEKKDK